MFAVITMGLGLPVLFNACGPTPFQIQTENLSLSQDLVDSENPGTEAPDQEVPDIVVPDEGAPVGPAIFATGFF